MTHFMELLELMETAFLFKSLVHKKVLFNIGSFSLAVDSFAYVSKDSLPKDEFVSVEDIIRLLVVASPTLRRLYWLGSLPRNQADTTPSIFEKELLLSFNLWQMKEMIVLLFSKRK